MVVLLLLMESVVAGAPGAANTSAPGKQAKQLRLRGMKAVMHVYSYAPKTLEITSVTSHLFKDLGACESAVGGALSAAVSVARAGELLDAECVALAPAKDTMPPEETYRAAGFIEL